MVERKRGRLVMEKIPPNVNRLSKSGFANVPIDRFFLKRTTTKVATINTEIRRIEETNCSLADMHNERKRAVNTKFLKTTGLLPPSISLMVRMKHLIANGNRTSEKALISEAK
jgi:hypothetical protein